MAVIGRLVADTSIGGPLAFAVFLVWVVGEGAFTVTRTQQPTQAGRRRAALIRLQLAFFGALAIGWLDFGVFRLTALPAGRATVAWLGAAVALAGIALRLVARATLRRNFSPFVQTGPGHHLVTGGVYAWVRHPAYTGFVGMLVGFPLMLGSLASLAFSLGVGIPALVIRIREEEAALGAWFGEAWRDYAAVTPRLFPGVW